MTDGAVAPDGSIDPGTPDAAGSDAPDVVADGLIAWYPLDSASDGTTVDATGNGHDAACVPDPADCPSITAGRIGAAMEFDKVNHLRVSAGDGSFDTATGFTIAAWVWLEMPYYSSPLAKMLGPGSRNSWQFEFGSDQRPAFTTSNAAGKDVDFADDPVEPATWVHLAGVWDGAVKRFYVDGVEKYELDYVVGWDRSDFLIGGDENDGAPALMFGGRVDDVRIYGRPLAAQEVGALASAP